VNRRASGALELRKVRRSAMRILRDNVLCSMATVTSRNRAHVNTAYFSFSNGLELYFLSDPASLHSRNLSTNRSMAVAVYSSSQTWGGPDRGLQLFGTCSEARGAYAGRAERAYARRFADYALWRSAAADRGRAALRFYRFRTTRLKLLDEAEFGDAVFVSVVLDRSTGRTR
jgi:uncharacterized protein